MEGEDSPLLGWDQYNMPQDLTIEAGSISINAPDVVKRVEKGSRLTHQEVDDNFDRAPRRYVINISAEIGVTDDLDAITGSNLDDLLILRAAIGNTITVKHNVVNLKLLDGADFILSGNRNISLIKTVNEFAEMSRSNNA